MILLFMINFKPGIHFYSGHIEYRLMFERNSFPLYILIDVNLLLFLFIPNI